MGIEIEGPSFVSLVHLTGGVPVVKASGEIDLTTAGRFRGAVCDAILGRPERYDALEALIVIDLSGVDFMDSCGVSALAAATRSFRNSGGMVRIVTKNSPVIRTLGITGLSEIFDVFPDVSSAARRGVA